MVCHVILFSTGLAIVMAHQPSSRLYYKAMGSVELNGRVFQLYAKNEQAYTENPFAVLSRFRNGNYVLISGSPIQL